MSIHVYDNDEIYIISILMLQFFLFYHLFLKKKCINGKQVS